MSWTETSVHLLKTSRSRNRRREMSSSSSTSSSYSHSTDDPRELLVPAVLSGPAPPVSTETTALPLTTTSTVSTQNIGGNIVNNIPNTGGGVVNYIHFNSNTVPPSPRYAFMEVDEVFAELCKLKLAVARLDSDSKAELLKINGALQVLDSDSKSTAILITKKQTSLEEGATVTKFKRWTVIIGFPAAIIGIVVSLITLWIRVREAEKLRT